jgi:hypothetical protein
MNNVQIPANNIPETPAGDANPGASPSIHGDAAAALAVVGPEPSVSSHNATAGSTLTVVGSDGTVLSAMMPVPIDLLV